MPNKFENGGVAPEMEVLKRKVLGPDDVRGVLEKGGGFEDVSLLDQDLAGFKLEGKSFRRSDARGLKLFREEGIGKYEIADIRNTDWTDADVADFSSPAFFCAVEAEGARFGFTETLTDRESRQKREGKEPAWNDCGGYHNFVGNDGGFKRTQWTNIDFGGLSGHEAVFSGADFTDAVFEGCALCGIDLSEACLKGVKILDFYEIVGLKISERYADDVANGLRLSRPEDQKEFVRLVKEVGAKEALQNYLSVWVKPVETNVN